MSERSWFDSTYDDQFRKNKVMNIGHKIGKLNNRLNRLRKKTKEAPADRQGQMTSRIAELEELIKTLKK